jgi:hypothetical protein
VFFVAAIWACIVFWRRARHDPRLVYLFSMGAPLFLIYLFYTFHSGVLPNWIAPSVLPMFCVMVIYWDTRWRLGVRALKGWLIAGLGIGAVVIAFMHETDLVQHFVGRPLPPKIDPLTRVRGYREMAATVAEARDKLLAEGKPVFIIAGHYGTTGELSFYLPEARTNVVANPLVYFLTSSNAVNQFYFWPGYENRTGQNAIFVREMHVPRLAKGTFNNFFMDGWVGLWLKGEPMEKVAPLETEPQPAPMQLLREFDSVKNLGMYNIYYRGRIFHTIQLFECRNLR